MKQGSKEKTASVKTDAKQTALDYSEKLLTGQDGYADAVSFKYIYNFYKSTNRTSPSAYRFCHALEQSLAGIIDNFPLQKPASGSAYPSLKRDPANKVSEEEWENIGTQLKALSRMPANPKPALALENMKKVADYLEMDQRSREVLELIYLAKEGFYLDLFMNAVTREDRERRGAVIARMFEKPTEYKEYGKVFDFRSNLSRFGFLYYDDMESDVLPMLDESLTDTLNEEELEPDELLRRILGKPMKTDLDLKDFEHIGGNLDLMCDIIDKAIKSGKKGVNILLWGPAGGGKTELAKAVAKKYDLNLYAIGEDDSTGDDPNVKASRKRVSQLKQAQALLKDSRNTLLAFDEIEDLLIKGSDSSKKADTDNKVEINRLLEENDVVTIWMGNDLEKFHEAVRQRFTYALYMDYQPTLVRQKIWQRQASMQGYDLSEKDSLALARTYAAPPRMIAKAVEVAKLSGGGMAVIKQTLKAAAKVVYGSHNAIEIDERVPEGFSPDSINAGENGAAKIENLIAHGKDGNSFSLYVEGKKGSGAGSMNRYIGEQMGMNVMEASMADLCMPTQQQTPEMRVSEVFMRAEDSRQFLVVNDIEYLKANPTGGNWEGSLTETFVRLAQGHKLPFAVTSTKPQELPDELEFIFTDKLKLQPLNDERAQNAWQKFFNRTAPEGLAERKNLLLGDFAEVAKLSARSGEKGLEDGRILELLDRRIKSRGMNVGKVGF